MNKLINKNCELCGEEMFQVTSKRKYCDKCRKFKHNQESFNRFHKNQENKKDILDKKYCENFYKVIKNNGYTLTTKGFDKVSSIKRNAYRIFYKNTNWAEILKMFNKYELACDYVKQEYIKYYNETKLQDLHKFGLQHPFITYEFIINLDKDKIMKDCGIRKLRNKEEDYKSNFFNIKNDIGRVPFYYEFRKLTKISIENYAKNFNLTINYYDNIVKMYCSELEYNQYLIDKRNRKMDFLKNNKAPIEKIPLEILEKDFKMVFDNYYKDFKEYPSKRIFNKISSHDDSVYRKRLEFRSWIDICKYYGYNIPPRYKFENSVLNAIDEILNCKSERQKSFKWLRSEKNGIMRLDGYYENYKLCIEADGQGHFKPIKIFGGNEKYKAIIKNDKKKNELVKEHGLLMLRIRIDEPWYYKDFLIEKLKEIGIIQINKLESKEEVS